MDKIRRGDVVDVHTSAEFNCSRTHPGIVTHVWSSGADQAMVNVKVLPDCGAPFDVTSLHVFPSEQEGLDRKWAQFAFVRPE